MAPRRNGQAGQPRRLTSGFHAVRGKPVRREESGIKGKSQSNADGIAEAVRSEDEDGDTEVGKENRMGTNQPVLKLINESGAT